MDCNNSDYHFGGTNFGLQDNAKNIPDLKEKTKLSTKKEKISAMSRKIDKITDLKFVLFLLL